MSTSDAGLDILACRLIVALCVACTVVLFGRCAIGPLLNFLIFLKYLRCVDLKKCFEAPESNFALRISCEISGDKVSEATGEYLRWYKICFNLFIT